MPKRRDRSVTSQWAPHSDERYEEDELIFSQFLSYQAEHRRRRTKLSTLSPKIIPPADEDQE